MATLPEDNSSSFHSGPSLQIGMWDQDEHCRFLRGIVRYGKDWKQVREVIGTRREKQIQSHFQKYTRRVAKMVKKIKRKGTNFDHQDADLESEKQLYRQLFMHADITRSTPSQVRSMILCVCPSDRKIKSPRKERNIILREPKKPQPEDQTDHSVVRQALFGGLGVSPVRADSSHEQLTSGESWSHSPKSFFIAVSELRCDEGEKECEEDEAEGNPETYLDGLSLAGFLMEKGPWC